MLKSFWATSQTTLRGGAANPKNVSHWFSLLSEMTSKFSIVPELMFAMDETCCFIDKSTRRFKVIGCSKQCSQTALKDENRESVTLIPLVSASGHLYPPTIIFKGKQLRNKAMLPNPLGASLQCSQKGYMNGVVGKEWISQDFDPATCKLAGD